MHRVANVYHFKDEILLIQAFFIPNFVNRLYQYGRESLESNCRVSLFISTWGMRRDIAESDVKMLLQSFTIAFERIAVCIVSLGYCLF